MKVKFDFDVIENDNAKRFEFNSTQVENCSFHVGYDVADNLTDAKICVYKALKRIMEEK